MAPHKQTSIPPRGVLYGEARAAHLRDVQADMERVLRSGKVSWSRRLSITETEALMVRAVEAVTGKDAEHARRDGEALAEEYTGGEWLANRKGARP